MTTNNNLSPLPFYKSLGEQHHKKEYAYNRAYPLICKTNLLLPFFICTQKHSHLNFSVYLYNIEGEVKYDLSTEIVECGLGYTRYDNFDVIHYSANIPMSIDMAEGWYYLIMGDGHETWYSEIFQVVSNTDRLLCLEWWDNEPLYFNTGCIPYNKSEFVNRLYLPTQIGKPEYSFEEEGEERDGFFFPVSQLSEKKYKFVCLAPEYLCDVMRTIRMSDHIRITSEGKTYNADKFLPSVDWQEQGDLASVTCEFETDTIIKKIGRTYTTTQEGDFTNDYNNDYFKS